MRHAVKCLIFLAGLVGQRSLAAGLPPSASSPASDAPGDGATAGKPQHVPMVVGMDGSVMTPSTFLQIHGSLEHALALHFGLQFPVSLMFPIGFT